MVWTREEALYYAQKGREAKEKKKGKKKGRREHAAKPKAARKKRSAPRARTTRVTKKAVNTMVKGVATLDRNIDSAISGLQRTKGLLASAAEEFMSGRKN